MDLSRYSKISQRDYEAVSGPDWPTYQQFQQHENVQSFVYEEIDQILQTPRQWNHLAFCVMPFFSIELPNNVSCCLLQKPYDIDVVRKQMLAGQRPRACQQCWSLEDAGYKSDRMIKNETLDWYSNQDIFAMYEQCQRGANKIIQYKIDTSNTCNSTCVTCNSFSSSLWGQYEQRNGVAPAKNWHLRLDQVAEQIDFANAKSIGFRGGEPLLSATNFEILEQLAQAGNTDCFINFTTNGSVPLSQAQKNILAKFSNINMCFSIDGTGSIFEYLRYPLKWNDMLRNIDYCRNHNIMISASFTVSNLNVFYLPQIIQWFDQNQIRYLINAVSTPVHFSARSLPQSVKQVIMANHSNHTDPIIGQLLKEHTDRDDLNYLTFCQEIAKQDSWKGIRMRDYLPELAELLG